MSIKARFMEVARIFANDPDDLDLLEMAANNIIQYVARVCTMETRMVLARHRLDGEEWRQLVTDLDTSRRRAHDAAISMLTACNRLAVALDAPKLYEGDLENREAVGDFCGAFVDEFFKGRAVAPDGWKGPDHLTINEWIDAAKEDGV